MDSFCSTYTFPRISSMCHTDTDYFSNISSFLFQFSYCSFFWIFVGDVLTTCRKTQYILAHRNSKYFLYQNQSFSCLRIPSCTDDIHSSKILFNVFLSLFLIKWSSYHFPNHFFTRMINKMLVVKIKKLSLMQWESSCSFESRNESL